jgi:hypothetical protein
LGGMSALPMSGRCRSIAGRAATRRFSFSELSPNLDVARAGLDGSARTDSSLTLGKSALGTSHDAVGRDRRANGRSRIDQDAIAENRNLENQRYVEGAPRIEGVSEAVSEARAYGP